MLISGTFLAAFYFRMKRYYVEHLVFSLYYYSFDFFCKSAFCVDIHRRGGDRVQVAATGIDLFYPIAFRISPLALKRVYQQKWPITSVKTASLFLRDTPVHRRKHGGLHHRLHAM